MHRESGTATFTDSSAGTGELRFTIPSGATFTKTADPVAGETPATPITDGAPHLAVMRDALVPFTYSAKCK